MDARAKYRAVSKEIGLIDDTNKDVIVNNTSTDDGLEMLSRAILMGCCVIAESIRNVMDEDPVTVRPEIKK